MPAPRRRPRRPCCTTRTSWTRSPRPGRSRASNALTAILLALAAAASWGVSDFLGGLTSRKLSLPTVMAITTPLGLGVIGAIVAIRGDPPPATSFVLWGAATGVLGAIGISALYQGMTVGRIGVVAPISATAPLVPIVFGLARGERPSPLQGVGIACALVGMVLTSL